MQINLNMKHKIQAVNALCLVAIMCVSCSKSDYRRCDGAVWGTTFHIVYRSDRSLDDSVHSVMRSVELSLSPFCSGSIVSKVNRNEPVTLDSMFVSVFELSCRVNRLSGGAFDPTVAPIVNLWGFGYRNGIGEPTAEQIDSALTLVGMQDCKIIDGKVVKRNDATEFNFSAIAKGYGTDAVAEMLRRNGCRDYMVEIGGEIVVAGDSPRGGKWNVAVNAPVESADSVVNDHMAVIAVSDCAVATSGNYRNYRDTSAGRIGHTINPRTGMPVATSIRSVTIVAPACALADALATACMAMPSDSAMAMIESLPDVSALFVQADSVGEMSLIPTSRFPHK